MSKFHSDKVIYFFARDLTFSSHCIDDFHSIFALLTTNAFFLFTTLIAVRIFFFSILLCLTVYHNISNSILREYCFQMVVFCLGRDSPMAQLSSKYWTAGNHLIRTRRKKGKGYWRWIIITSITLIVFLIYVTNTCVSLAMKMILGWNTKLALYHISSSVSFI